MEKTLSCSLTPLALRHRKETVLPLLRSRMISRQELPNGYSFTFPGDDATVEQLSEFIKTERACCRFFTFELIVQSDENEIILRLLGPLGVKDFIRDELEFIP